MGNCLFKAKAHQLYNDGSRHLEIRAVGVQYLQNNPERFIESVVVDISWSEYITNMSMEWTWGDHIIMQAIAESMNLRIHIIESSENFAEVTLVEPLNVSHNSRSIYIYGTHSRDDVSTITLLSESTSPEKININLFVNSSETTVNK